MIMIILFLYIVVISINNGYFSLFSLFPIKFGDFPGQLRLPKGNPLPLLLECILLGMIFFYTDHVTPPWLGTKSSKDPKRVPLEADATLPNFANHRHLIAKLSSANACRATPTFHLKGGHFVQSTRPCRERQRILYQPC